MIGTSTAELLFIRFCIVGLHYLVPLCILYTISLVAVYGLKASTYRFPLVVESIAIAETLFYLLVYLPRRYSLQREAIHPSCPTREERAELFQLCNNNIPDPEGYVQKWFLGAPLDEIKRENVKDFLLWAFFNRGGPPGEDDEELEEYVSAMESLLGRPIDAGRGNAKCLRLTLDKVLMLHRSLIWYFVRLHSNLLLLANMRQCVGFVDFLTYMRLLAGGFHFHRTSLSRFFKLFPFRFQSLLTTYRSPAKHTMYWHRPHTSTTKLPVVFIHGIGIGLYPYTSFLNELNSSAGIESSDPNEQVGILAIEIMPISFRLTHHALGKQEQCEEIDQIISKHFPNQKVILVSHSYGSVITTHLLETPSTAARIGPVVLIDPVTILLHLPEVAYNFTRRKPKRANEYQLQYFASMDMGVSHTLGRHFFWNENVLWKKDMGDRRVTVSLGGRDLIVNTEAVGRYLSSSKADETRLHPEELASERSRSANLIDLESDEDSSPSLRMMKSEGTSIDSRNNDDSIDDEEWKTRGWAGTGIDVLWFRDLDHAQVFDKQSSRRRLINAIHQYCDGAQ
jgi:pimeloyl-ACP methyl ester carboxylesterase